MAGTVQGTAGTVQKQEADVLYMLVLLFTCGQLALVLWDLLTLLPEIPGMLGLSGSMKIHSTGGITLLYLVSLGAYIGRNAWRRYSGKEERGWGKSGYFSLALWCTVCSLALLLKEREIIGRLPYGLALSAAGVTGALLADIAVRRFPHRRRDGHGRSKKTGRRRLQHRPA